MAIQSDETLVTKGDLKTLYTDKILPYLGGNMMMQTGVSDYYSEDEKVVGVWIDGKPVYQLTVVGTIPTTSTQGSQGDKYIALPSGVRVDKQIDLFGWMEASYGILPGHIYGGGVGYVSGAVITDNIGSNSNTILIRNTMPSFNNKPFWVTVKYTKVTDTASSALTAPGCYDLNRPDLWPENKEIFFGNGLYGQRFTGTFTSAAETRMLTHIYNYPIHLINYGGYVDYDNNGDSMMLGYHQDDTNFVCALYTHASDGLYLFTKSPNARTNAPYDIWVTYTK